MYTFSEIVSFFFIYAFFGWCMEVAYAVTSTGKFINRGFLNGPVCPIYGFGMVTILLIVAPIEDNLFLLFLLSTIFTTMIEFFTGFVLEKIFKAKWWDYTDLPFNIKGYVCLKFSIIWGIACTFVVKIIHSLIYGVVSIIPDLLMSILLICFSIIILTDIIVTVSSILKLKKRLKVMDKLALEIKEVSNNIGKKISVRVLEAKEKNEEIKDKLEDKFEALEKKKENYIRKISLKKEKIGQKKEKYILACKAQYDKLLRKKSIWQNRIINEINWTSNNDLIEKIKEFQLKNNRRR